MPGTKMTYITCFDDHRTFTEDVRKRFSDSSRYKVSSFYSKQEFINECKTEKESTSCRVALIGVPDTKDQFEMIDDLTQEIKKRDPGTGIILLGSADKMEDLKKIVKFNIDAYIPRNSNAILRIHNAVKKLISENSIVIFRKRRNIALYVFFGFLILTLITIILAYIKLPQYF